MFRNQFYVNNNIVSFKLKNCTGSFETTKHIFQQVLSTKKTKRKQRNFIYGQKISNLSHNVVILLSEHYIRIFIQST